MKNLEAIKREAEKSINFWEPLPMDNAEYECFEAQQTILRLCAALEKAVEQRDEYLSSVYNGLFNDYQRINNQELESILEAKNV